jgi:hypothetical protein
MHSTRPKQRERPVPKVLLLKSPGWRTAAI